MALVFLALMVGDKRQIYGGLEVPRETVARVTLDASPEFEISTPGKQTAHSCTPRLALGPRIVECIWPT